MPSRPLNRLRGGPAAKAGFTLVEILAVLAIVAFATGVVMLNGGKLFEGAANRAEVYNFQRQLLDLKERAFREDRMLDLREPGDEDALAAAQQIANYLQGVLTDADGDGVQDDLPVPLPVALTLSEGYAYTLEPDSRDIDTAEGVLGMAISPRGDCTPTTIAITFNGAVVSTLVSDGTDGCHLARVG